MAANEAALLRIESTFWSREHAPRADALRLLQRVHDRGGIAGFIAEKQLPGRGPRFQKRVDANRFTGLGYGEPARLLGRLDGIRAQAFQIHPSGDGAPRNHGLQHAHPKLGRLLRHIVRWDSFDWRESKPEVGHIGLRLGLGLTDERTGTPRDLGDTRLPFAVEAVEQKHAAPFPGAHHMEQIMRLSVVRRDPETRAKPGLDEQAQFAAGIGQIVARRIPAFVPRHRLGYPARNLAQDAARMSADPQAPEHPATRPADSVRASWLDAVPRAAQPYFRLMRLDRPIGAWLLYWPCVFGLALGAATTGGRFPDPLYVVLTGIGAVVMRGAGCTYNDIVDRDFDARVARTRGRPIASGAVSVNQAWGFAIAQALVGFLILLAFNPFAIVLGVSSLFLIGCYPFMKRITWWPQAWLGLTFNWGVPFGFAAASGTLGIAPALFYAGCFCWTLGYDTIYAHQDKEDDILIGVKSLAIRLGARTLRWMYGFYAAAFLLMLAGGFTAGLGIAFGVAMLIPGAHLIWQLRALDIDRPVLCLKLFKANRDTGALIAAALLLGLMART
jgi:4-hydroxybenzoate polyprenyltransferase